MPYEYIVTLSTIPSKLQYLPVTLDSLINQSIKPKKIILQIPEKYDFRLKNQTIDHDQLHSIERKYAQYGFEVHMCKKDHGPATKLVGLLEKIPAQNFGANQKIVVIDDDLIYHPKMIETLNNALEKSSVPFNGAMDTYPLDNIIVGQACDGFILEPNSLKNYLDFFYKVENSDDGNFILHHDDVVLSYYLNTVNSEFVEITPPQGGSYKPQNSTNIDALHNIQGKYSRDNLNKEIIKKLHNVFDNEEGKTQPRNIEGFGTMTQPVNIICIWLDFLRVCGFMR